MSGSSSPSGYPQKKGVEVVEPHNTLVGRMTQTIHDPTPTLNGIKRRLEFAPIIKDTTLLQKHLTWTLLILLDPRVIGVMMQMSRVHPTGF